MGVNPQVIENQNEIEPESEIVQEDTPESPEGPNTRSRTRLIDAITAAEDAEEDGIPDLIPEESDNEIGIITVDMENNGEERIAVDDDGQADQNIGKNTRKRKNNQ